MINSILIQVSKDMFISVDQIKKIYKDEYHRGEHYVVIDKENQKYVSDNSCPSWPQIQMILTGVYYKP